MKLLAVLALTLAFNTSFSFEETFDYDPIDVSGDLLEAAADTSPSGAELALEPEPASLVPTYKRSISLADKLKRARKKMERRHNMMIKMKVEEARVKNELRLLKQINASMKQHLQALRL